MGLEQDIFNAFKKSQEAITQDTDVTLKELSKDLTDSIVKFLKAQEWTIDKMRAFVEIEKFKTLGPLNAMINVTTKVGGAVVPGGSSPGGMLPGATGIQDSTLQVGPPKSRKSNIVNEPIVLDIDPSKSFHGGSLNAYGHAYIGPDAGKTPVESDTKDTNQDQYTSVTLKNIINR